MGGFLRNLALLVVLGIVIFLLFPDMMKGVLGSTMDWDCCR
jgi:hypothetical protein